MFGLAAAPEMATAVPSVMPPPYSDERRYPSDELPQCGAVMVNDSALRCCQASRWPATRLSVDVHDVQRAPGAVQRRQREVVGTAEAR